MLPFTASQDSGAASSMTLSEAMRQYWEDHPTKVDAADASWGSKAFFEKIQQHHDNATAFSNAIVGFPNHKRKRAIDVYCGLGLDALTLARHGADVTYVGPAPRVVALTRRYFALCGMAADLREGDVERLAFPSDMFDVALARSTLMYAPDPQRAIDELFRIVKPGGEVYAHLYNRWSWYPMLAKVSGTNLVQEPRDPPVLHLHSARDARRLFRGFSSVELHFDRFPMRTTQRGGLFARLYNGAIVPLTEIVPKSLIRPLGFYIIIKAVK